MTRARSWSFSNLLSRASGQESQPELKKEGGRLRRDTFTSVTDAHAAGPFGDATPPQANPSRPVSRPMSIVQPYQPPTMEVREDTLPELQPIFNFMNNHSQKMYTEGYFLKLTDLTPDGKPAHDRSWQECFAQLVGTVLSLWDAAELDAAGPSGEVAPAFLNLTDASIKMIDKLPTRSLDVPPLTNVLSISTAGRNRYLFHFNSHHSLVQWTASIRLSMFELSRLQEIYTGALISGKGRSLNAINAITARTRHRYEEWVRVRFGAGTPWRKCWAVITQPDDKSLKKSKAGYERESKEAKKATGYQSRPTFKGNIKFFDNKKTKKQQPIATIVGAYAAYAIYPQSKQLIDHSTLIKIEGQVVIHGDPPSESEGYVFVMPDVHPAVGGFETMLRFLFPTFDSFALYGRPGMLIPDKYDARSLMFGMPREGSSECGYLDTVDVVNLIVSDGKGIKLESDWRAAIRNLTQQKIESLNQRGARPKSSVFPSTGRRVPLVNFDDNSAGSVNSVPVRTQDLPPLEVPLRTPGLAPMSPHQRSVSESATDYLNYRRQQPLAPSTGSTAGSSQQHLPRTGRSESSSEDGLFANASDAHARRFQGAPSPEPVPVTPATSHPPSSKPLHPMSTPPAAGAVAAAAAAAAYHDERRGSNQSARSFDPPAFIDDVDNLFDGVVPLRKTRQSIPPAINPMRSSSYGGESGRATPDAGRSMGPAQNQYHEHTQITEQSAMGYENQMEPPPGFALQQSQVLLRGPPPTNDAKQAFEQGYAMAMAERERVERQQQQQQQQHPSQQEYYSPQSEYNDPPPRFSWVPTNNSGGPANGYDYVDPYAEPMPSPPYIANNPTSYYSNVQASDSSSAGRKPFPGGQQQQQQYVQQPPPRDVSPASSRANSLDSLARAMMNPNALERIGMEGERPLEDEDTLDRKAKERLMKGGDSDSEYDSEPDYASIDSSPRPVKRDYEAPRAGRMKVVGQEHPPPEVVVGDAHYTRQPKEIKKVVKPEPSVEIPTVDFGMTISHGSALTGEVKEIKGEFKDVSKGTGLHIEQDSYPASQQGTLIGTNEARRHSTLGLGLDALNQNRDSSRSSSAGDRRASWNRPSPDREHSQGSDSDNAKRRRSIVWTPGMATGPGAVAPPEQYVSDKISSAREQQQTRNRHVTNRRSGQALRSGTPSPGTRNPSDEHLPRQRPLSAFMTSTPDLRGHLSATEQEYIARQTGGAMLHNLRTTPPPHTAGLVGLVDKREREKERMKEVWRGGQRMSTVTVQQEIDRRERERQAMMPGATPQGQRAYSRLNMTPSPRPTSTVYGEQQQGYFPPTGTPGQFYTPQPGQMPAQAGYFDQRMAQPQQQGYLAQPQQQAHYGQGQQSVYQPSYYGGQ